MSQNITFNGVVYTIPSVGDDSWGQSLSDFLIAIPQSVLQKTGGNFTLSADVNFGANFGILSRYFSTRTALPATSGILRLSLADTIAWRNNANTADLLLAINGTDQLTFDGDILQIAGDYITGLTGDVTATGPGTVAATISANAVTNDKFRQATGLSIVGNATNVLADVADIIAGTDNTVLLRDGTGLAFNLLTNNNIDAAAAIEYSKLALTGSIVNADISGSAAIAYSKLNLAASIVNADIANGAAIAYAKLALTGSIVNADISGSAAIGFDKLAALASANILVGSAGNVATAVALSGDATLSNAGVITLGANVVTNAKSAQMAAHTIKGNNTGSAATPIDLTATQVTAELNAFVGDSGAGGTKGLVPAPAAGDGAATKVLRADGTWGAAGTASPLTTKGDIYTYGATNDRLPIGTDGQILTADSAQSLGVKWATSSALANPLTTTGDMIYSSPGSTLVRLPVGSSGNVLKVQGGVPTWSTPSTGINYVSSNPDAEVDTTGWDTYADGAAVPVDGTGGTPTATITRTTSSPLRGTASFLYTNGALGNGVSYAFTISAADQAKNLQVSFDWNPSATIADGDFTVYVYDVTNAVLTQVIPYKIGGGVTSGQYSFKGSYQTASNSTSYRLIINQAVASPGGNLKFDNVYVGPQSVSYTSPMTDFTAYTPTFAGFGTPTSVNMFWRRVGDSVQVFGSFVCGTSTGTLASVSLPTGLVSDSVKLPVTSIVGSVNATAQGQSGLTAIIAGGQTALNFGYHNTGPVNPFTAQNGNALFSSGNVLEVSALIPIAGWSSSAAISQTDSSEGRVVAFSASGWTVSGGTTVPIIFTTVDRDTHAAYNAANGRYTVPVTGWYDVHGSMYTGGGASLFLYKNGSIYSQGAPVAAVTTPAQVDDLLYLIAGDIIDLRPDATVSGNTNASRLNKFTVARISGNQSITAAESVNAFYTGTPTGTLNGSANNVTYGTKVKDSHGGMSGATYTVQSPGTYSISAGLIINSSSIVANGVTRCMIYVNGSAVAQGESRTSGASATLASANVAVSAYPLNSGDTINIKSSTDATGPSYFSGAANYFSIARVGN